jgi:trans-2,3-dihydro-3-hydroxyanthranilate isomerase
MGTEFVLCDVFTDRPFAGNPLAVFPDATGVSDEAMALIAREFGWSEITFVLPGEQPGDHRVRIWTPVGELPFAGHPTIGTAVVMATAGHLPPGLNTLILGIGPVEVDVTLDGWTAGSATMTQRAPEFGAIVEDRAALAGRLGLSDSDLVPELPAQVVSTGLAHLVVPLRSLDALGRARPREDTPAAPIADGDVRWAYLFTTETPDSSAAARARLVAPGLEDAATGSAAGPLGAYLVRYGVHRPGVLDIEQGVEMGRPSRLQVDVPVESGTIGPIRVTGEVRIWGRGQLTDPAQ